MTRPTPDPLPADIDALEALARRVEAAFIAALHASLDGASPDAGTVDAIGQRLALPADGPRAANERALALYGLDQWGLAYAQAFGADCLSALTALMDRLRADADAPTLAALQRITDDEDAGFAFKRSVRNSLHLGLWHAMVGDVDTAQGRRLAEVLGSLMLALLAAMPTRGGEILALTFATIQIRCMAHGLAQDGQAKALNTALFAALHARIDASARARIIATADQLVQAAQSAPSTRH